MKLIDLLQIIDETTDVNVLDQDDNILGRYDGSESIDPSLNDREINNVQSGTWRGRHVIIIYLTE